MAVNIRYGVRQYDSGKLTVGDGMVAESERVMRSSRALYQTPRYIRNPSLDGVYSGVAAPVQDVKMRLRRAYVVAGVLIGVSLATAIVPVVYVASTSSKFHDSSSSSSSEKGNWTVCWPCRATSTNMCCATLAHTNLRCSTITAVHALLSLLAVIS